MACCFDAANVLPRDEQVDELFEYVEEDEEEDPDKQAGRVDFFMLRRIVLGSAQMC